MNPLAIYKGLQAAVECSPFSKSVEVAFGWDVQGFELTTRFRLVVRPGDLSNSVGPADAYAPTLDREKYVGVQHWFTTITVEADDSSPSEEDQFEATMVFRNWLHAEMCKLLPAARMEIVAQQYARQQERVNHCAVLMVIRTSEWIEKSEDTALQSLLVDGRINETVLDLTESFDVPRASS